MRYIRRLQRDLGRGAALVTEREFTVRFEPLAAGFVVGGQQVSARVDAPARLAQFARLEEQRVETGLFPLELDAGGRIVGGEGASECDQFEIAYKAALSDISGQDLPETERDQLTAFIGAMHAAGGTLVTELPRDLFAPLALNRSERRAIEVPGGQAGQVSVDFIAEIDRETGLMRHAMREVSTALGQDARVTVESWSLLPA